MEDKNFALFNYVNELNNEIELLQEQINEVTMLTYFIRYNFFSDDTVACNTLSLVCLSVGGEGVQNL